MSLRLIQRFGTTLTFSRPSTGGSYVNGDFVPGDVGSITLIGSLQPLTAREQEFLPGGSDEKEKRKLYTTTKLNIQESLANNQVQEADTLDIDGKIFQVIAVEPHLYPGKMTIQFYKIILEAV